MIVVDYDDLGESTTTRVAVAVPNVDLPYRKEMRINKREEP